MPLLNNIFEPDVSHMFILELRTFLAKSALSRLRAFGEAILAKI